MNKENNLNFDQKKAWQVGSITENLAAQYLESQGLVLLRRNYKTKIGEIDLVMRDGDTIVFVEVKYRHHEFYGNVREMVTNAKKKKIIQAAKCYLLEKNIYDRYKCRFDFFGINRLNKEDFIWIRDCFSS